MKHLFKLFFFCLCYIIKIESSLAQQFGVGIMPYFNHYYGGKMRGYDTTGYAMGRNPTFLLSSKKIRIPQMTPTFIRRYNDGKRLVDFNILGVYKKNSYLLPEFFHPKPINFYTYNQVHKGIYLRSTVHARLLADKNERIALWMGVSRIFFWESTKTEKLHDGKVFDYDKNKSYGMQFGFTPTLQYRINGKWFVYLRYSNPSNVRIYKNKYNSLVLGKPFIGERKANDVNLVLYQDKFKNNFQFGARYFFQNTHKKEESTPIKPKKKPILSKTYWGIGLGYSLFYSNYDKQNVTIYTIKFREDFGYGVSRWQNSPSLSFYKISNFNKKYQEFYITNPYFYNQNKLIPHLKYVLIDTFMTIDRTLVPGIEKHSKIVFGYVHYQRINKLSKGIFNLYWGTNVEYGHEVYRAIPTDHQGFMQYQRNQNIKVALSASILWRVTDRINIETKWLPHSTVDVQLQTLKAENPIDIKLGRQGKNIENISTLALTPSFQLGLKYALNVDNPNKKKKKKK